MARATAATATHQDDLRHFLVNERNRLRRSVEALAKAERALGGSQDGEGPAGGQLADVASDAAEQELDLSLEAAERTRLAEVEAALDRLARGVYGRCEGCGQPIPVERLVVVPWARLCLGCAVRRSLSGALRIAG